MPFVNAFGIAYIPHDCKVKLHQIQIEIPICLIGKIIEGIMSDLNKYYAWLYYYVTDPPLWMLADQYVERGGLWNRTKNHGRKIRIHINRAPIQQEDTVLIDGCLYIPYPFQEGEAEVYKYICATFVENIVKEIMSDPNQHGTRVEYGTASPTIYQLVSHYVKSDRLSYLFATYANRWELSK